MRTATSAMLLLSAGALAATAASTVPTSHLFMDTSLLASPPDPRVWRTVLGNVTKEPSNPLLVEDQKWDVRWDNTYITVRHNASDSRAPYRMWWNSQLQCSHGLRRTQRALASYHAPMYGLQASSKPVRRPGR